MKHADNFSHDLDSLIREAMVEPPLHPLPDSFTDRLMAKVEKRIWWKEVLTEFGFKLLITGGTLLLVILLFIIPGWSKSFPLFGFIANYWQLFTTGILLTLLTFSIDQILLKYLFRKEYPN